MAEKSTNKEVKATKVTKAAKDTKETKAAKETKEVKKPAKPVKEVKTASKVYHISKRKDDNKWQVKAEGADKALKLFLTQEEAIEFAKKTAGNQEARIVIHKADGSFRSLTYKKKADNKEG